MKPLKTVQRFFASRSSIAKFSVLSNYNLKRNFSEVPDPLYVPNPATDCFVDLDDFDKQLQEMQYYEEKNKNEDKRNNKKEKKEKTHFSFTHYVIDAVVIVIGVVIADVIVDNYRENKRINRYQKILSSFQKHGLLEEEKNWTFYDFVAKLLSKDELFTDDIEVISEVLERIDEYLSDTKEEMDDAWSWFK